MAKLFMHELTHKVSLPYDIHWRALAWAKKHCSSYITNEGRRVTDMEFTIIYYFGSAQDATLFALRWL